MSDCATLLKLKVPLTWTVTLRTPHKKKKKKHVWCVTCRRVGGVVMAVVLKSADNFSYES